MIFPYREKIQHSLCEDLALLSVLRYEIFLLKEFSMKLDVSSSQTIISSSSIDVGGGLPNLLLEVSVNILIMSLLLHRVTYAILLVVATITLLQENHCKLLKIISVYLNISRLV